MLYGYGSVILDGALVTIEQALLSVVLSFLLGLIGAAAKSSQSKLAKLVAGTYTTLIRGVPDLVLMLLIFYGLQIAVNTV
ncbi:MAG: histidine ABC transporter permease, partial [Gammaproteobacteria bacterium]|nr:histidine ABC transporter permease [Gammaproteobacteria bacterium]